MNIEIAGPLIPGATNTLIDSRGRIETLSEIEKIKLPAVGMFFYCMETEKVYVVKKLKAGTTENGYTIADLQIESYEELAKENHSHSEYAEKNHSHAEYAAANHDHSGYAKENHSHNEYAQKDHSHSGFSPEKHTHFMKDITDFNIGEISSRCGFSSQSYFCRVFKDESGMTPLQYQKSLSVQKNDFFRHR